MAEDQNLFDLPPAVRARRRFAEWRAELKRTFRRMMSRAATPEERAQIEQAYAAELERGPDWLYYWGGSKRADPHEQPPPPPDPALSPSAMLEGLERFAADAWAADKAAGERKRYVQQSALIVYRFMCKHADDHCRVAGRSIAEIAAGTLYCVSTVVSALAQLEAHGFLAHDRMRRPIETPLGEREVQAPNCYRLCLPEAFRIVKGALNAGPVRKVLKFAGDLLGGVSRYLAAEEEKTAEQRQAEAAGRPEKTLSLVEALQSFVPPSDCKIRNARPLPINKPHISTDKEQPRGVSSGEGGELEALGAAFRASPPQASAPLLALMGLAPAPS